MHSLKAWVFAFVFLVLVGGVPLFVQAEGSIDYTWVRQFGSIGDGDSALAIDANGDVYVIGHVQGALPGETYFGLRDAFVRKYNPSGGIIWTDQFGTGSDDLAQGIVVSGDDVYVVGKTGGELPGEIHLGGDDAFIRKYDTDGNVIWTDQFGTSVGDEIEAVAATSSESGVYVAGNTFGALPGNNNFGAKDAFARRYNADGSEVWTVQFGTNTGEEAHAITIGDSAIYVGGFTEGEFPGEVALGGRDGFIFGFDESGTTTVTMQFGTDSDEEMWQISADGDDVYVVGNTFGVLPGEVDVNPDADDAFIQKYDMLTEDLLWSDQFGSGEVSPTGIGANAFALVAEPTGVYVGGFLDVGGLPDQTEFGGIDAYVREYDVDGSVLWTTQFGTADQDLLYDIVSVGGNVYAVGLTEGVFPGETDSGGVSDAFVIKFTEDTDGDGIFDHVDTAPATTSSDFSDATTTGSVITAGDQVLQIIDAAVDSEGVFVAALPGGGALAATISACDGATNVMLDAGESATITCGSAFVAAVTGSVSAVFFADDGTIASTTLDGGNAIGFDPITESFTAPKKNTDPVEIIIDGEPIELDPGEGIFHAIVEIFPQNPGQCIDPGSPAEVPVLVLGSSVFTASSIVISSLSLEGAQATWPLYSAAPAPDVNDDGFRDRVARFENALELDPGQTEAVLTGRLRDGNTFDGVAEICVEEEGVGNSASPVDTPSSVGQ